MARGKLKKDLARTIFRVLEGVDHPLSTGQICDLLMVMTEIREVRQVRHGRSLSSVQGPHWEVCPKCDCTEEAEVSRPYMAPRVRAAMKRLTRQRLIVEIPTETPNNKGGHLWLRADQADQYYRKIFE